jgi:hypothetical protein
MNSTYSLLLRQIDQEVGPDSQVRPEHKPHLVDLFHRDLEQEPAYQVLLTEEERRDIYDLLSTISND